MVSLDCICNLLGCRIVDSVNGPSLHDPTGQEYWIVLPEWHAVCSKMNTLIERPPSSEPVVHWNRFYITFKFIPAFHFILNNTVAGYLLVGLTFMMLTLTVFYDIPQLNFGLFFLMRSDETTGDPEKVRLQTPGAVGPKYTQQLDDGGIGRRAVVRVKSRRDDSPSPEDTTPVHARP